MNLIGDLHASECQQGCQLTRVFDRGRSDPPRNQGCLQRFLRRLAGVETEVLDEGL